jgi:hypothetical protein
MNTQTPLVLFEGKYLPIALLLLQLVSCRGGANAPVRKKDPVKAAPAIASETKRKTGETWDILDFLLTEESAGDPKASIDQQKHTVSFPNDGDRYEVSFSQLETADLNHDGIKDYIVMRHSEGMLGGNANTNSEILYLIMAPDNQINQRHEILTYAPFSYNILEDIRYQKGKLKAQATQNFRTYTPEEGEELQSTDLSFVYRNGNVYEESYLSDCELAKWKNKHLFNKGSEVKRSIETHNYTEEVHEKLTTKEFDFSAIFSGCDNLNLVLEATFTQSGKDPKLLADKRTRFLEYLANNTSLSKEFKEILLYLKTHEPSEQAMELEGFSFNLFTNREKGKTVFRLVLDQNRNPDQTENWEITTRQ